MCGGWAGAVNVLCRHEAGGQFWRDEQRQPADPHFFKFMN